MEYDLNPPTFDSLAETYNKLRGIKDLGLKEKFDIAHQVMQDFKQQDYYFFRRLVDTDINEATVGQKHSQSKSSWLNLASNDYLNLTTHPEVIKEVMGSAKSHGVGAGSVPMLAGTFSVHRQLENELARITNCEAAITFNSGFIANIGLLETILGPSDVAILDTYVHASIIDGCYHTRKLFFQHNDPDSLNRSLNKVKDVKNKVVVIDGVYSMDGDIADLPKIMEVTKEHGALLVIDESHAIGVIGDKGHGTYAHFNMKEQADIVTGSLGKALAGIGGFVSGSSSLMDFLELYSRPFIFSTAIPPSSAAGNLKAIKLMEQDELLSKNLYQNVKTFKKALQDLGFHLGESITPIQPLFIEDTERLMKLCLLLHGEGILVNPIVFPVVPKKKSRIRVTLTSVIEKEQLDWAIDCFARFGHELDLI